MPLMQQIIKQKTTAHKEKSNLRCATFSCMQHLPSSYHALEKASQNKNCPDLYTSAHMDITSDYHEIEPSIVLHPVNTVWQKNSYNVLPMQNTMFNVASKATGDSVLHFMHHVHTRVTYAECMKCNSKQSPQLICAPIEM